MSSIRTRALTLWSLLFVGGCYSGDEPAFMNGLPDLDGGVNAVAQDLPCDVSQVLTQYCIDCHNHSALSASKRALDSYAALTTTTSSGTAVELALARLESTSDPMPPSGMPRPSAGDIQVLQSWAATGYPRGTCALEPDGDAGTPSVYDTPVMCSSETYWTGGNRESPRMHPGGTCIACHTRNGEGPRFGVAGTLYATAHEPNDCNGASQADVSVIVTDANGMEIVLHSNTAGNFYLNRIAVPYKARVERAGQVRAMAAQQTSGDCNACHTQTGSQDAPGRIMIP
jgi:hypothetical protein